MHRNINKALILTSAALLLSGCTEVLSFGVGFGAGYATHYFVSQNQQQGSSSGSQDQLAQRTMASMQQGGANGQYSPAPSAMAQYPAPSPSQYGNPYAPKTPNYMSYPGNPVMASNQPGRYPAPAGNMGSPTAQAQNMQGYRQQAPTPNYNMPPQGQSPYQAYQHNGMQKAQPPQPQYAAPANGQQYSVMPQQPHSPQMGGYYAQQAMPSQAIR